MIVKGYPKIKNAASISKQKTKNLKRKLKKKRLRKRREHKSTKKKLKKTTKKTMKKTTKKTASKGKKVVAKKVTKKTSKKTSKKTKKIIKKEADIRIKKKNLSSIPPGIYPQYLTAARDLIRQERLRILVLIKPFKSMQGAQYHPVIEAMKKYAEIRCWSSNGNIQVILEKLNWKPDFIFIYDYESSVYSPFIADLHKVDIPKGCYVLNIHDRPELRRTYILKNNVDLLFASSKQEFLKIFPESEDRFRGLPCSIHPEYTKDRMKSFNQCAHQLIAYIKDCVIMKNFSKRIKTGVIPQKKKLKVLMLIKEIDKLMPKHQHKYDMIKAIQQFADVYYWHKNGDILEILKEIKITPDFILHYDIEWNYFFSPQITNLAKVKIPKACYVLDIHWRPYKRKAYFHENAKPDIIFSATKNPFLKAFPECIDRFRWVPFAINTDIITDYRLKKDIDFSLMGLLHPPGRYPFRERVLERMNRVDGFVHFEHPGQKVQHSPGVLINSEYARTINRTKMFFTCGSDFEIPVAKFFEGPGCKSLLMAKPNQDILELGFKDGVNFIACDENNLYEKAMYYQTNNLKRELITQNGYNFIQTFHNNQWRAYQIVSAMKEFLKRK
ncbi:glycosyltransferase family protein [Paenibacillus silviterrae]|uniref:glycosyltransferase family protein n=1 Tax=Paenibacillus silviterrae TaxID=3242194 RepID=UPI002542C1CF|nr:glycosyltransferase [Paenibacillus chinjuensis]